ncbi:MAG: adenine phosphoribosyltransferase [Mariniphaga sp.]
MRNSTDLDIVKNSVRNIPDFPKPGIQFKDVTTSYNDGEIFGFIASEIYEYYKFYGITKVVGIESRGFILGSVLANRLNVGFVPIRKPGKLPAEIYSQKYALEYGFDTLEIHQDALSADDVVLIHDDLLATGGTVGAAIDLVRKFGVSKIYVNFFVELDFLKGSEKIDPVVPVWSLVHF